MRALLPRSPHLPNRFAIGSPPLPHAGEDDEREFRLRLQSRIALGEYIAGPFPATWPFSQVLTVFSAFLTLGSRRSDRALMGVVQSMLSKAERVGRMPGQQPRGKRHDNASFTDHQLFNTSG